jgi:hypothetical protein
MKTTRADNTAQRYPNFGKLRNCGYITNTIGFDQRE